MKDNEKIIDTIESAIDTLTYWIGYTKGTANMLRSATSIDPLVFSAEFESISRDFSVIKNSLITTFYENEKPEDTNNKTKK